MPATFGRTLITTNIIKPTKVCVGGDPVYKPGGITIDTLTLAAALSADLTLPDGSILRAGAQYLRYGQVMCEETTQDVQTLTITGTPTGGTFTLTYLGQTTTAIPYNATAAQVQTALQALPNIGPDNVTVAGGPGPGTPYVVTFGAQIPSPAVLTHTDSFAGGASPALGVVHTTTGSATLGQFGPYDPAASDGRQTLTRGRCFILDELWVLNPTAIVGVGQTLIIGGCLEGGLCILDRIVQSGTATHTLAAGPTFAELMAAFPSIRVSAKIDNP